MTDDKIDDPFLNLSLYTFLFSSSFCLLWLFRNKSHIRSTTYKIASHTLYYTNLLLFITFQIPVCLIGAILYPVYGKIVTHNLVNLCFNILDRMFLQTTCLNKYPNINNKTHLLLGNHTSSSDSHLRYIVPYVTVTIVKNSLFYVPFLGQVCWLLNFIFIKRESKNSRNNTKNTIIEQINNGVSIQLFPQGTREQNKSFQNNEIVLKKGSMEIAILTNVPIVLWYHNIGDRVDDKNKMIHLHKKVYAILSDPITLPSEYSELPLEEKVDKLYEIIYSEFTRLEKIVSDKIRTSPS
jgi:1-acyl-sn-glycerol-3-phosphate acyltransferase